MPRDKLFPPKEDDVSTTDRQRTPHGRFSGLASKVLNVPKREIDAREKAWREEQSRRRD